MMPTSGIMTRDQRTHPSQEASTWIEMHCAKGKGKTNKQSTQGMNANQIKSTRTSTLGKHKWEETIGKKKHGTSAKERQQATVRLGEGVLRHMTIDKKF